MHALVLNFSNDISKSGKLIICCTLMLKVLKDILLELGYDVPIKSRKRISWVNFPGHQLNSSRPMSAAKLKEIKENMIRNGEIDVGEAIVPISYDVLSINRNGSLVSVIIC